MTAYPLALRRWLSGLIASLAVLCIAASGALARPIVSLQQGSSEPLGRSLVVIPESGRRLSLDEAIAAAAGQSIPANSAVLNLGIGHAPVWLSLQVSNPTPTPVPRALTIGAAWLDFVDIHVIGPDGSVKTWTTGDEVASVPYLDDALGYVVEPVFAPGKSLILLRIETPDPMVVQLRLLTPDAVKAESRWEHYAYGFLYGFLLSLIAYNVMLFIGLRRQVNLLYSLYLLTFVVLNIAYTGRGAAWLWGGIPELQRYAILFMMVLVGTAGLRFARTFLELDDYAPRLKRAVQAAYWLPPLLMLMLVALDWHEVAAWFAFTAMAFSAFSMLGLGIYGFIKGRAAANYFLLAALASVTGMLLTEFAVWGVLPLSEVLFHALEVGMMLDATLLALALAGFVRTQIAERGRAEREARLDPLTQLYNRRGFFEFAGGPYELAVRHKRPLSVIMADIDRFKSVNDNYGHATGDKVLAEMGRFLAWGARRGDVVARWGGEEFVLLLPETDINETYQLAERLRETLKQVEVTSGKPKIKLTASFGIAQLAAGDDLTSLIEQADASLLQAKESGRDRVMPLPPGAIVPMPRPSRDSA